MAIWHWWMDRRSQTLLKSADFTGLLAFSLTSLITSLYWPQKDRVCMSVKVCVWVGGGQKRSQCVRARVRVCVQYVCVWESELLEGNKNRRTDVQHIYSEQKEIQNHVLILLESLCCVVVVITVSGLSLAGRPSCLTGWIADVFYCPLWNDEN